jgi:hypothetical protein
VARTPRLPRRVRRRLLTIGGTVAVVVSALVVTAAPAFACPPLTITASPTTVVAGSDTTLTISATSNGNYTGAYIEVSSTGGPGALTSFTTLGPAGCGGGVSSCAADGSYYKLDLPALTNGEKFSYTIDLTIDASTAAGTFTPKAEFFESNGTNIGPQTGPVITVTTPEANLVLSDSGVIDAGPETLTTEALEDSFTLTSNGPDTAQNVKITTTISPAAAASLPAPIDVNGDINDCTATDASETCAETATVTSGYSDPIIDIDYYVSTLSIATYTITTTVSSTTPNPDPADATFTDTCSVTTVLISCSKG